MKDSPDGDRKNEHDTAADSPTRTIRDRVRGIVNPGTILAAALFAAFVGVFLVLRNRMGVPVFSEAGVDAILDLFGPWAPPVFVLVLAVTVVVSHLPGLPLTIAAGAMWGSVLGAALSIAGGLLGAIFAYIIGRYLGASIIYVLTGRTVEVTQEKGRTVAGVTIFVTRLVPLMPFDIISYGSGIAHVPFSTYVLATALGMAPSTYLLTFLGESFTGATWLAVTLTIVAAVAFVAVPLVCRHRRPACLSGIVTWHTPGINRAK